MRREKPPTWSDESGDEEDDGGDKEVRREKPPSWSDESGDKENDGGDDGKLWW